VQIPQDPDERTNYVATMFGRIAPRYDRMNSLMSAGKDRTWRRLAVRLAEPPVGGMALDLGCGTGDLALELARYPLRQIFGVDLTGRMVELGKEKVAAAGLTNRVQLGLGDATNLPFGNDTFDCAATAFTLRNVVNISRALEELVRVTRPGGRVVSLEIFPLGANILAPLIGFYFRSIMPLLGGMVAGDREAYTYLPDSVGGFMTPQQLAELMEKSGIRNVGYRRLAFGTVAVHVGQV
jgi:demethylmenaquinone methyltransferase/2-methoxy-6-polyprenyl-1,4-benzoquinol methylase